MIPSSKKGSNNFRQGIDILAIIIGVGLILGYLIVTITYAFYDGAWPGLRSLAASILPLLVTVYLGFLIRLQLPTRESQAPKVNNFIMFILWTMLILGLADYLAFSRFPLAELLYSLTLAALVMRYQRHKSLKDLAACCYGIICGCLGALILFG